ncbi:MAG: hypothetical protein GQ574_00305 [Crocinitomix sp.]|nr:hypothetical protein [Crocinitomix sp.]
MMVINLRDIFTKSKFGEVQLGQSIEEVKKILGEPAWDSFSDSNRAKDEFTVRFLTYDSYEFWFIKYYDSSKAYKLSAFQNDSYQYQNAWEGYFKKSVHLDFWIFEYGITMNEIENALDKEQLNYVKYKKYETTYLEFENKSKTLFEHVEHLNSIACVGWMFHPEKQLE